MWLRVFNLHNLNIMYIGMKHFLLNQVFSTDSIQATNLFQIICIVC